VIHDARPRKVIPVYLQGTDTLLPKGKILPRLFKTVTIQYGKPLDLSRFYNLPDSLATSQQIVDEVMREIVRLKENRA
jgi:1-acyl-sn-glycerol-3-phosphate acyltransferase